MDPAVLGARPTRPAPPARTGSPTDRSSSTSRTPSARWPSGATSSARPSSGGGPPARCASALPTGGRSSSTRARCARSSAATPASTTRRSTSRTGRSSPGCRRGWPPCARRGRRRTTSSRCHLSDRPRRQRARAGAGDRPLGAPLAPGATVGHVHLHVPDPAAGVRFHRDVVGVDEHMPMPTIGMADLGAGGRFPHRLALDVWSGPDAVRPPAGTAGLRLVTLRLAGAGALDAARGRLQAAGIAHDDGGDAITIRDPAGNPLRLTSERI